MLHVAGFDGSLASRAAVSFSRRPADTTGAAVPGTQRRAPEIVGVAHDWTPEAGPAHGESAMRR
jgi:hypothetical protein